MARHCGQKWSRLFLRSSFQGDKSRCHSIKRDANPPFENLISILRALFSSVENFSSVEKIIRRSRTSLSIEKFFVGQEFSVEKCFVGRKNFVGRVCWCTGQRMFSRQSLSRGINKMASSDGSSARDMLKQILGRIGDLSAAIDQQGSSSSRVTTPQTTTSVESEVRSVFGVEQGNVSHALFICQRLHPFG